MADIPADLPYVAWEIDQRMVDAVNRLFEIIGQKGRAECRDVLCDAPPPHDLVLLLKMLPCLEQQRRGCGERILRGLDAKWVVVSFPLRSLSGKDKGMKSHYGEIMARLVPSVGRCAGRFELNNEMFWIVAK